MTFYFLSSGCGKPTCHALQRLVITILMISIVITILMISIGRGGGGGGEDDEER